MTERTFPLIWHECWQVGVMVIAAQKRMFCVCLDTRLSADLGTWLLIGAGGEELLSQKDPVAATESLGRQRYFGW